jgi:PAS domain S-box-containing protein
MIANEKLKREIEERERTESALQESEEKHRTILESIEEGYYEIDLAGKFTFFNDALCKIIGYTRDELMGMHYKEYTDEKGAKRLFETFKRIYTTGKPGALIDYNIIRKDGTVGIHETLVTLIKDSKGQPIGFRGISRDVTKRRHLEAQLKKAQKMETIGTLAGGVAHDLNNILSGIVSYPELLLMDLPEGSPLKKPLLTIQKSGEKAATIVQDLLTLARRGVAVTEVVSLNTIISDYFKSPEFEKLQSFYPNIAVKTDLETNLFNILGSPVHLSKSVMNLVSNAAEAMSDEGMIFISTENRYIDKPLRGYDHVEEGDYVTITVSDTGVGISTEDMEKIFEPFYTKKLMGRSGTGLGMAVVWGTVKDHKGYIDVQSMEGKGTTFTLYFPISRRELAEDKFSTSIEDFMGKGETLLVVDDVEEQREIASQILKKLGYSVTSVASGEKAIDYMQKNSADLLILDMIMDPGIDGLETYKRILKLHPSQKAIIASGFSETNRVKEAQRLGAGAYVKKPYILEKIGLAIKKELDR